MRVLRAPSRYKRHGARRQRIERLNQGTSSALATGPRDDDEQCQGHQCAAADCAGRCRADNYAKSELGWQRGGRLRGRQGWLRRRGRQWEQNDRACRLRREVGGEWAEARIGKGPRANDPGHVRCHVRELRVVDRSAVLIPQNALTRLIEVDVCRILRALTRRALPRVLGVALVHDSKPSHSKGCLSEFGPGRLRRTPWDVRALVCTMARQRARRQMRERAHNCVVASVGDPSRSGPRGQGAVPW